MPGKVNPVMCESLMQVAARVMGNDQVITVSGAAGGQFQLNIMMPVMGTTTLESVRLLAACTRAFVDFCVALHHFDCQLLGNSGQLAFVKHHFPGRAIT